MLNISAYLENRSSPSTAPKFKCTYLHCIQPQSLQHTLHLQARLRPYYGTLIAVFALRHSRLHQMHRNLSVFRVPVSLEIYILYYIDIYVCLPAI